MGQNRVFATVMLKQVFLASFEPVLTEFRIFRHMYAPSCALCTPYIRMVEPAGVQERGVD